MFLHLIFCSFLVKFIFESLIPAHYTQSILTTIFVQPFSLVSLLKCSVLLHFPFRFHMFYTSGFQPPAFWSTKWLSGKITVSCISHLTPPDKRLTKIKIIYLCRQFTEDSHKDTSVWKPLFWMLTLINQRNIITFYYMHYCFLAPVFSFS